MSLNGILIRRIVEHPRGAWAQAAVGVAYAALAVAARLALNPLLGAGSGFIAFVPAVMLASAFGGARAGAVCVAVLALAGGLFFTAAPDPRFTLARRLFGMAVFAASGAFMVWIAHLLHTALRQEREARDAERLLRAELQHRVKNTLAVVQSLANQTFRAPTDREALRRDFTERLVTLGVTHTLLDSAGWREVTMDALATSTLAPYLGGHAGQVRIAGERFTVPPEQAVTLALCLNELVTNAAKYGALARPDGRIDLTWTLAEEAGGWVAHLTWAERGGPPVRPPAIEGFGARLLRRGLGAQPRAVSELAFLPEGVRWRTAFAVDRADGGARSVDAA